MSFSFSFSTLSLFFSFLYCTPFLSLPLYVHDWVLGQHTHCVQIFTTSWLSFTRWHGMYLVRDQPSRKLMAVQFSSVQLLSCVQLFASPWTAACQACLSITNSWSLLKLMSIESVMPSNHLIFCRHLLLPPSIFPSIRVFSNESVLCIRWPKDWSFSFNISPSNEYSGLISLRMDWFDLFAVQETLKSLL